MDELEKNIPDDFWGKAFEEASEAPPPRVWDAIEHRLDESNNPKILPLWGAGLLASRSFSWGVSVAAAMALLLVGWWLIGTQPTNSPVAHQQKAVPQKQLSTTPDNTENLLATKRDEQLSEAPEAVASAGKQPDRSLSTADPHKNRSAKPTLTIADDQLVAQQVGYQVAKDQPTAERMMRSNAVRSSRPQADDFSTGAKPAFAVDFRRATVANAASGNEADVLNASQIEQLASRPMRLRSLEAIHRIVWFRPAELSAEPEVMQPTRNPKEVWASVSMMPGSFNPAVAIRSSPVASFAAAANQPSINSRSNFSVAYQAGAGVQLTERWSVESGIGYLSGHSTVQSPGQTDMSLASTLAPNVSRNSAVGNLYADAVRNSTNNTTADVMNSAPSPIGNYNNVAISKYQTYDTRYQQEVANNYEYVQVPVQFGYQLRPHKRLSMALLGGLLTNIFVRNTIGDDLVITGKDGVYRPLMWAATMGARFRYRPSGRWSASLAGMYQPALGSGTRSASQVESSPTSAGMSFGLDYHF